MKIHYLIILEDAIVDADEDKKMDKNGTLRSIIFAFCRIKIVILQSYYNHIKFILQAMKFVVFNTKML